MTLQGCNGARTSYPVTVTGAELRVLRAFMIDGGNNATVARRCGVNVETVKTHFRRIYARLGYSSRTELALALERGHIELRVVRSLMDISEVGM